MWFRRIFLPDDREPVTRRGGKEKRYRRLKASSFQQLDRLQIRGSKELRGDRMGQRSSHRRKPSVEFVEHRSYVPGDDIRFVDWRASARHDNVFVRQGELPKEVVIYLLLDCSASMRWGDRPKSELQKQLALSLGYMALSQGDRLYIHPYGGNGNIDFGPVSGKGQFGGLAQYLAKLKYGGEANLAAGIKGLKKRITRGGVLFVLSDLLERGDIGEILASIPAPVWWVNVLHLLHPQEINPELRGRLELVDVETGIRANYDLTGEAIKNYEDRIEQWRSTLELACVKNHAFYALIDTESAMETEVIPYLRSVKVLVDQ